MQKRQGRRRPRDEPGSLLEKLKRRAISNVHVRRGSGASASVSVEALSSRVPRIWTSRSHPERRARRRPHSRKRTFPVQDRRARVRTANTARIGPRNSQDTSSTLAADEEWAREATAGQLGATHLPHPGEQRRFLWVPSVVRPLRVCFRDIDGPSWEKQEERYRAL